VKDKTVLGVVDYQLYLLHTMSYAPPELIVGALGGLGVDQRAAEVAYRHVNDQGHALWAVFDEVCRILGTPAYQRTYELRGREVVAHGFTLPLWENLAFEVSGTADGLLADERFRRMPGTSSPALEDLADLVPWKFTLDEVRERFGPLRQGDLRPPFEEHSFHHTSPDGVEQELDAVFSWGLLQRLTVAVTAS